MPTSYAVPLEQRVLQNATFLPIPIFPLPMKYADRPEQPSPTIRPSIHAWSAWPARNIASFSRFSDALSVGPLSVPIRAVARAYSWKEILMSGKVTSVEALAKQVGQERRHVTRTLALAFLSPNITRAILNGDQPAGLRLTHLLNAEIPLLWSDQSAMIERLRQQ